jgi:TonB family protein
LVLFREVTIDKAKFSETITETKDGEINSTVTDLINSTIIKSETYKGMEPVGIWLLSKEGKVDSLNYDFKLVYTSEKCEASDQLLNKKNTKDTITYFSQKLDYKSISYPTKAIQNNISGKVIVKFTVTEESKITDICILNGVHPTIDKEAMRFIKNIEITNPTSINGIPVNQCMTQPVTFNLF